MNAPHARPGATLATSLSALVTLAILVACASSGQRPASTGETSGSPMPETTPAATAPASPRGGNHFVLTAAEIERAVGVANAYDAVRSLRPHFFRMRGTTSLGTERVVVASTGRGVARTGRSTGQARGGTAGQPTGSADPAREPEPSPTPRGAMPADVGIVVYLDRQRLGGVETLRDIPVAMVEEIRLLNIAEANNLFGRNHPHGVILVTNKHATPPPE